MSDPVPMIEAPAPARDGYPWKAAFVAMVVVSIWIVFLCTAPQMLTNYLWPSLAIESDLPLRHLLQVVLNSVAVLVFILVTGRASLLVPRRPARPLLLLLLVPLVTVNLARGPLMEFWPAFIGVTLLSTFLTGCWEEFLFRGLIQERLSVLGPRLSLLVTSILFGLIHSYGGIWPVFVAFSIGLAFSLVRDRVGLWPLVIVHGLIDLTSALFVRRWESFHILAYVVIGTYFAVGGIALVLTRRARDATIPPANGNDPSPPHIDDA